MSRFETKNEVDYGVAKLIPLAFAGHCYYVRACENPDDVGGIILTERAKNKSLWAEVLAVGPNVGKPCEKKHQKMFSRPRTMGQHAPVGSLILCPCEDEQGIEDSPVSPGVEYFIEESCPLAYDLEESAGEVTNKGVE